MSAKADFSTRATDFRETAIKYFEPQLIVLGLGKEQIENQNLPELRRSLETINEAIQHPESFGVLKLTMGFSSVVVVTSESHMEVGILPILLERKKLILERISLLEKQEEIVDLREKAKSTIDQSERVEYERKISDLQAAVNSLDENRKASEDQLKNAEKALQEAQSEARKQEVEEKREKFKLESWERRTKVWQKFLERESVATIVGGLLLVLVTIFLMIATNWNAESFNILSNAFLLILGFFFGQSAGRASSFQNTDKDDSN